MYTNEDYFCKVVSFLSLKILKQKLDVEFPILKEESRGNDACASITAYVVGLGIYQRKNS